jgi:hypothetical protein
VAEGIIGCRTFTLSCLHIMLRRVAASLALVPALLAAQRPPSAGAHCYDDSSRYTSAGQLTSGCVGPELFWEEKNHDLGAKPPAHAITYHVVENAMRYDWSARPTAVGNVEQTIAPMPRWHLPPTGTAPRT